MRLYLIRHAHALSEEDNPSRPLSVRGREQCAQLAAFFRANGAFTPAQLWHSPLERARETAAILVQRLGMDLVVVETPGLLPEDAPQNFVERLMLHPPSVPLAIVGHEPHLSALASLLVRGKAKPALFALKKAGVIVLEPTARTHKQGGHPRWEVCWHLAPELLSPKPGAAPSLSSTGI